MTNPARLRHLMLHVSDVALSLDFYVEVLGGLARSWVEPCSSEAASSPLQSPPQAAAVMLDGISILLLPKGGHARQFGDQPLGLGIYPVVEVPDLDLFHQRCVDLGRWDAVSGPAVDQPWGWRELAVRDPDGYVWTVIETPKDS